MTTTGYGEADRAGADSDRAGAEYDRGQDVDQRTEILRLGRDVDRLSVAMFGHPLDSNDGLIKDVRTIRETVEEAVSGMHEKLERLYLAVLALAASLIAAAVIIALATAH